MPTLVLFRALPVLLLAGIAYPFGQEPLRHYLIGFNGGYSQYLNVDSQTLKRSGVQRAEGEALA